MAKRKIVSVRAEVFDYLEGTLGHVRSIVDAHIEKFGEDARLVHHVEYDYDSETHYWYIEYERQESDDEYNKRMDSARKARERRKAEKAKREDAERQELARLLAKYSEKE